MTLILNWRLTKLCPKIIVEENCVVVLLLLGEKMAQPYFPVQNQVVLPSIIALHYPVYELFL
jgi:hypothetical protein